MQSIWPTPANLRPKVRSDERFECSSARVFEDWKSNRREVLRVSWRADATNGREVRLQPRNGVSDGAAVAATASADASDQEKPLQKRVRLE